MRCFNPRPPKRTLCPKWSSHCDKCAPVSIHVLRRGRCVLNGPVIVTSVHQFQSTSSEEDVVSGIEVMILSTLTFCFNPRPPKRTLCQHTVSCTVHTSSFNPRPPKRTLCLDQIKPSVKAKLFQSTSSEEDVVSGAATAHYDVMPLDVSIHVLRRGRCVTLAIRQVAEYYSFNPRPPKRTLCPNFSLSIFSHLIRFQSTSSEEDVVSFGQMEFIRHVDLVSIHVLRRGRCVYSKGQKDVIRD